MTFPHFGEITQMKVGNNRYYLVWKCLSRNSLNYTVKCGKRIYAYDTTVLERLDRYNEIVGQYTKEYLQRFLLRKNI